MAEIETPPRITVGPNGDKFVTFGPEHTDADITRWIQSMGGAGYTIATAVLDRLPKKASDVQLPNKYNKRIRKEVVDVYDVLRAFNVTDPGLQHGIKKMLMPGIRGDKTRLQDLLEARQALDRAIDMERENS